MFEIYIDPGVKRFMLSLNMDTRAKVDRNIGLLEEFGYQLGMPHTKKVSAQLFELRIQGQLEVRIFYCFHNNMIKLLHGFVKKSQKIPARELSKAYNKYRALDEI